MRRIDRNVSNSRRESITTPSGDRAHFQHRRAGAGAPGLPDRAAVADRPRGSARADSRREVLRSRHRAGADSNREGVPGARVALTLITTKIYRYSAGVWDAGAISLPSYLTTPKGIAVEQNREDVRATHNGTNELDTSSAARIFKVQV